MKEIYLEIPGKPVAKQRPRFYRKGNFVGTYKDQETEEGRWIWEARNQITPELQKDLPLTNGIVLNLVFIMPITKAFSKSKIQMIKLFRLLSFWALRFICNLVLEVCDFHLY